MVHALHLSSSRVTQLTILCRYIPLLPMFELTRDDTRPGRRAKASEEAWRQDFMLERLIVRTMVRYHVLHVCNDLRLVTSPFDVCQTIHTLVKQLDCPRAHDLGSACYHLGYGYEAGSHGI